MRRLLPALICLLGLLSWGSPAGAQEATPADDASVLVLGRVSDDPKAHYDQLKPLLTTSSRAWPRSGSAAAAS